MEGVSLTFKMPTTNHARQVSGDFVEKSIKDSYEAGEIYKTETICNRFDACSGDYVDRLLADKISTVRRNIQAGPLVDLCCATGEHLFTLADASDQCIGIDFSRPFIDEAKKRAHILGLGHVSFQEGDAKNIPLKSESVATLYSFSALYVIPDVQKVLREIVRVLRVGGRCVLDLGNSHSLNSICVKSYTELPPSFHISVAEMLRLCKLHGLEVIEHRAFQLLPLWAGKPRWLWPLLHPKWKTIMATRISGRMLDEWLSSSWFLRNFAFRHLLVCVKRSND
jgi:ubiquinone/menaquinone biosynthesis C-methylase UbiE